MKKVLIFSLLATSLFYISCETSRKTSTASVPATVAEAAPAQPELSQIQRDSIHWAEQKKAMKNRKANMLLMDRPASMDKNVATPVTKQNPKQ